MKQLDLRSVYYRLIAYPPNKSPIDITSLCESIVHKEDSERFVSTLNVSMKNVKERDYGWIHSSVKPTTMIRLQASEDQAKWSSIFAGLITKWTTHAKDHMIELTAYDMLHRMMQSEAYFYFQKDVNAKTRLETVGKDTGMKMSIKSNKLGVALPEADYNSSLAATIEDILDETNKLNDSKHIARSLGDDVGIEIITVGENDVVYEITDWSIAESSHEIDIEDLVTVVKVYGNKEGEGKPPLKSTHKQNTEYGEVVKIISTSSERQSDADKEAKEILKEKAKPKEKANITTADIPWLRKGDKINIATGTFGSYKDGQQVSKSAIVHSIDRNIGDRTMNIIVEVS